MNHFSINGVESRLPFTVPERIEGLLSQLRQHFVSESSLITSIRIDGLELNDADETAMSPIPLESILSVEIFTAHPREVAEETLQSLLVFTHHLEQMCLAAAEEAQAGSPGTHLARLVEGIRTFSEAVTHARQILKIGILQKVNLLETDLVSIMNDLTAAHRNRQTTFMAELLSAHLTANFSQWRTEGIPAIIRSRDS